MKPRLLLFFTLLFTLYLRAEPPARFGGPHYGFSYGAAGVISIFKVDTRHSEKAIPRAGFGGNFRVNFYTTSSVHIQVGLEVLSQACAFNSYYFAPGHSVFYDRSFGYTHTLRTIEMYIPFMARIGLTPGEATARGIFYVVGGYSPKLFLGSTKNIVQNSDGHGVTGGPTTLTFENWFIGPQMGNVLLAGFGVDKRIRVSERFVNFELLFRYNLSRFKYDLGRTGNDPLLIKNMCISLQVGYRFAAGGRGQGVN